MNHKQVEMLLATCFLFALSFVVRWARKRKPVDNRLKGGIITFKNY